MRLQKMSRAWKKRLLLTVGLVLLTACSRAYVPFIPAVVPTSTVALSATQSVQATAIATVITLPTSESESTLPTATGLYPANWEGWPVLPIVTQHAREVYTLGQSLGNDPHAFSIFGDCQSLPEIFLGLYATDSQEFASLSPDLQATANYFKDSLNRESSTSKGGTTSGALLWDEWHENKYDCRADESPMDCELRTHRPSFVLIMVGTHTEGVRDDLYLRKVLDALLAHGVVPILSTKADNREGDNHINLETAKLAAEYNIPLWNFWPVTSDLPNRGLYTKKTEPQLGDIYLTDAALERHRLSALQVLDEVRRAVAGN